MISIAEYCPSCGRYLGGKDRCPGPKCGLIILITEFKFCFECGVLSDGEEMCEDCAQS